MHLRDRHVGIPVRDGTLGGVRLERDGAPPERRWDDDRIVDAVAVELRIVLPRSPRIEDGLRGGGQRRRQRDDGADVEIMIRQAVYAPADAGRHRVIDRRVTQRARDAYALDMAVVRDVGLYADDRIAAQEFHRGSRAGE